ENQGEELRLFRLLPAAPEAAGRWQPSDLTWSDDKGHDARKTFISVAGFSQQIAAIANTASNEQLLEFARIDGQPTEPTIDLLKFFADSLRPNPIAQLVQTATLLIMLGVFATLFILRRQNIMSPPRLSPDTALAFTLQRLIAASIDFVPIAVLASYLA